MITRKKQAGVERNIRPEIKHTLFSQVCAAEAQKAATGMNIKTYKTCQKLDLKKNFYRFKTQKRYWELKICLLNFPMSLSESSGHQKVTNKVIVFKNK